MTKQQLRDLPLKSMCDAVLSQLNITEQETRLFNHYYREGLRLQECADKMCIDIQLAQRLSKRIKFKLAFIDEAKIYKEIEND